MEPEKEGVEVEESQAPEIQEEVVDYSAELEKVKGERDNYKQGMLDAKDILKGKGIVTDPDDIKKLIDDGVNERLSQFTSNFAKSTVESTLTDLSSSDAEKELIRFHYENSVIKSGLDPASVRNDLENAKLLANKKTFFKEAKEMKIAMSHKANMSPTPMGSSQESPEIKNDSFFTSEQIATLRKKGFDDKKIEALKINMAKQKER